MQTKTHEIEKPDGLSVARRVLRSPTRARYGTGRWTESPEYNPHSSLDLFAQAAPLRSQELNWPAAPADQFLSTMRPYLSKPDVRDGTYELPPHLARRSSALST